MKYDVKVYDSDLGRAIEKETIRGLSYAQMTVITDMLKRLGVRFKIIEIN